MTVYDRAPWSRRLEEPPILDYDKFIDEEIPSDTRMRMLFPDDVELRTKYRDTYTECRILFYYERSIRFSEIANRHDAQRQSFYRGLQDAILKDQREVDREFAALQRYEPYGTLRRWEFNNLDQDAGTSKLERNLRSGMDVFGHQRPEVLQQAIEKYGHLIPPGYFEHIERQRLSFWEQHYLDSDGGTGRLQDMIAAGQAEEIFRPDSYLQGGEARVKYGYLLEQAAQSTSIDKEGPVRNTDTVRAIFEPSHPSIIDTVPYTSKHESRTPIPERRSRLGSSTLLVFLSLVVLELYFMYHVYKEWIAWYG